MVCIYIWPSMVFFVPVSLLLLSMHSSTSAMETFPSHQLAPYVFTVKRFQHSPISPRFTIDGSIWPLYLCSSRSLQIHTCSPTFSHKRSSTLCLLCLYLTRAKVTSIPPHRGVPTQLSASHSNRIGAVKTVTEDS